MVSRPARSNGHVRCFEGACGCGSTSSVDMPTSAAPLPRAIPWPAAIATRSPVKDPGPTATATRSTDESAVLVERSARSIAGKSSSPWRRCACQVSSARTSRPSKSATDAQSVDVSSANNTGAQLFDELGGTRPRGRDDDVALGIRDMLELDLETVIREQRTRAVRPLDHRHAAGIEAFLPAGVCEIDALEPVEVDVKEGQPAAAVLAHDDEGRARDVGRVDAEGADEGAALAKRELTRVECLPSLVLGTLLALFRLRPTVLGRIAPFAAPSTSCHERRLALAQAGDVGARYELFAGLHGFEVAIGSARLIAFCQRRTWLPIALPRVLWRRRVAFSDIRRSEHEQSRRRRVYRGARAG